jgi:hypothetical protein
MLSMRRIALLVAAAVVSVGAAGASASSPTARAPLGRPAATCTGWGGLAGPIQPVPNVVGRRFDTALNVVRAGEHRVAVARFDPIEGIAPEMGWGRLENYHVVAQSPAAGSSLPFGGVVHLTLDRPRFGGLVGGLAIPKGHPPVIAVPDLIGLGYRQAIARGNGAGTGVFVRVGATGPLSASASRCGLDAFVVSSQVPRPGTLVPWEGVADGRVSPRRATVAISLRAT